MLSWHDKLQRQKWRASQAAHNTTIRKRRNRQQDLDLKEAVTARKAAGIHNASHEEKAPPHVLAERDVRLAREYTSFTAAFNGDPLPGYSALDRRKFRLIKA